MDSVHVMVNWLRVKNMAVLDANEALVNEM